MATVRINISQRKERVEEEKYTFESLKENLRKQWENRKKPDKQSPATMKSAEVFPKILLALQCPSQLYIFVYYVIPRLFEDYDEVTVLVLQSFVWFCCVEGLINYFCTNRTDSSVKYIDKSMNHASTNGHVPNGNGQPSDDCGMSWTFCDKCNMNIPPRAHHCKICNKCILKRDHHCFMVGNCIGFYNQRYFFVLGFYAILCGFLAFLLNVYYLYIFYWPTAYSWTSLFPPVGFFRWLLGYEQIEPHILVLIFQAYPQLFFGFFGFIVVNSQMLMCVTGKTAYELSEKINIKNSNTVRQNFESVFGEFWILNFLFPMTLLFKQSGDGYSWDGVKREHNTNDKNHVTIDL